MLIIFIAALVLAVPWAAAQCLRRRHFARNPLAQVFRGRELSELDAHLEAVAREELHRLEEELARYLTGRTGHVVAISHVLSGVSLELSDGRRLAIRGISRRTVDLLRNRAPKEMLRPEAFDRDAVSFCLRLRALTGGHLEIYARSIALAG